MRLYRDEGVVLRTHALGEADRIVVLFTRQRGIIRAVAKGVRRTSSKFGARLEPFMYVDIQCYEGRSLDTVTQVELIGEYGSSISSDYDTFQVGNVIVEMTEKLNRDGPALSQYRLLVGALRTLSQGKIDIGLVRDAFLLRSIALGGWAPSFELCASCGTSGEHTFLSVQLGGVVCDKCRQPGTLGVDLETIALLRALLTGDWKRTLMSSEAARSQARGFVAAYVQWHLERGIRALHLSSRTP